MTAQHRGRDSGTGTQQPTLKVAFFLGLLLSAATHAWAKPMAAGQARKVIQGWLRINPRPLETDMGNQVEAIETFVDGSGEPTYYVAYLKPSGFVIVPADDLVEPIICFAPCGYYDPSSDNPLRALVIRDLPNRVAAARALQTGRVDQKKLDPVDSITAFQEACARAAQKWAWLQAGLVKVEGLSGISEVWVPPLVQSTWSQSDVGGSPCYNYYTPNNYVCGCVATMMAQLMRYHEHPVAGIGVHAFTIRVDGDPCTAYTRGGNGDGGPYVWGEMVLQPDSGITESQRQAIGALCYDAGVSAEMSYTASGSGASMLTARNRFVDLFDYSNAIYRWSPSIGTELNKVLNPSLDSGYPVMMSIYDSGGHAVLCDGYGYNSSTLYHHLNMGWGGAYDLWYDLPDVGGFDVLGACIYNVFVSGSGEIISGRVTHSNGAPIADVAVAAQASGGGTYNTTTNSRGIYALPKVPSYTSFTVTATKPGLSFPPKTVNTSRSVNNGSATGNAWGVDFVDVSPEPHPPIAANGHASMESGVAVTITLGASDDGEPDPPGQLTYIITSLLRHGTFADPGAGIIHRGDLPYTLVANGNRVQYCPCEYYAGPDHFHFKANDGGTPPEGGDSNIATVSIDVLEPGPVVICGTDFEDGLPEGWTIIDGYADGNTWTSGNPADRSPPSVTGTFMIVDSDWAGYGVNMDEELITPSMDCSYCENVMLSFAHAFWYGAGRAKEVGDVDVSVNAGPWQNLLRYEASTSGTVQLDLSSIADGQPDVRIRWRYYNTLWEYFWAVDDIEISGIQPHPPMPGDFEPDCDVDFFDFSVLSSAWRTSSGHENWDPACDVSDPNDNFIDERDLAVFCDNWLTVP